jgi:AraC-like DNA-binding protein
MFKSEKIAFTILSVHKLKYSSSERYSPPRGHSALIFRHYGKAEISYDKERVTLNKNDITFVPANFGYTIRSENEEVIAIHFSIDSKANYPFSFIHAKRPELFITIFEELLNVWKTKPLGYQYKIDALFLSILENVEIQSKTEITSPVSVHIYQAVDFMHKHFSDPNLSIDNLAKISGYCPSYFRRVFHEITGVSPQAYLCELRFSYADTLLSSGYYSVKEVAFLCGFEDPKYFSTAYKSHRKKSPSKINAI